MDAKRLREKLDPEFYGRGFMFQGLEKFKQHLKDKNIDVSNNDLQFYYDNQEIVQMFRPVPRVRVNIPITASEPFDRLYFDTMFLTDLNLTLVNAVDLFSKYGFCAAYNSLNIDSTKTARFLEAVHKDVEDAGFTIKSIYADPGSEFSGSFEKMCREKDIFLKRTDTGVKTQTAPIESFNRTVRLMIEKLRHVLDTKTLIFNQVRSALPDLLYAYNSSISNVYKLSPIQVLTNKDAQDMMRKKMRARKRDAIIQQDLLESGDYVRIVNRDKLNNPFSKLANNWSQKLYEIDKYDSRKDAYSLVGEDELYKRWELQPVDKDTLMKAKISRYISQRQEDDVAPKPRKSRDVLDAPILEGKRERKARQILDL